MLLSIRKFLLLRSDPQREAASKLSFTKAKEKSQTDSPSGSFFRAIGGGTGSKIHVRLI